jgi:hypothetical protein
MVNSTTLTVSPCLLVPIRHLSWSQIVN